MVGGGEGGWGSDGRLDNVCEGCMCGGWRGGIVGRRRGVVRGRLSSYIIHQVITFTAISLLYKHWLIFLTHF